MNKLFLRSDDRFVAAAKEKPLRDRTMQRLIGKRRLYVWCAMGMLLVFFGGFVVGILDNEPVNPIFVVGFCLTVMQLVLVCDNDNKIKTLRGLGELWDRYASDEATSPDAEKQ